MTTHDARARYCIEIGIERQYLRDDVRCPACDEVHALQHLDSDFPVLSGFSWCDSCRAEGLVS